MRTDALLCARDVTVTFRNASIPAVVDFSLDVDRGAAIGIVGESGSGKTTIANVLVGALLPSAGQVLIGGRPWADVGRKDTLRKLVQMVFQDPYSSLNPLISALDCVAEPFRIWQRLSRAEARQRAASLLADVGLSDAAVRSRPARLSGGQCQRVGIARALACEPVVLVADEPTSSLDVSVQTQILDLLDELRVSRGLGLVLVSHDLFVVGKVTEYVLVMYRGRVVEMGPTADVLDSPTHHYTKLLIDSVPGGPGTPSRQHNEVCGTGCPFAARCPAMTAACDASIPPLTKIGSRSVACFKPRLMGLAPDSPTRST